MNSFLEDKFQVGEPVRIVRCPEHRERSTTIETGIVRRTRLSERGNLICDITVTKSNSRTVLPGARSSRFPCCLESDAPVIQEDPW